MLHECRIKMFQNVVGQQEAVSLHNQKADEAARLEESAKASEEKFAKKLRRSTRSRSRSSPIDRRRSMTERRKTWSSLRSSSGAKTHQRGTQASWVTVPAAGTGSGPATSIDVDSERQNGNSERNQNEAKLDYFMAQHKNTAKTFNDSMAMFQGFLRGEESESDNTFAKGNKNHQLYKGSLARVSKFLAI